MTAYFLEGEMITTADVLAWEPPWRVSSLRHSQDCLRRLIGTMPMGEPCPATTDHAVSLLLAAEYAVSTAHVTASAALSLLNRYRVVHGLHSATPIYLAVPLLVDDIPEMDASVDSLVRHLLTFAASNPQHVERLVELALYLKGVKG